MIICFQKSFFKEVKKLKSAQKERLKAALLLFEGNPNYPSLV